MQDVAGIQTGIPLGALAVDLDALEADIFLSIGLKCSLLSKDGRYVLAFAGTDVPADWKDFNQAAIARKALPL